ncbi:MAG TPA: glutathione S-transferase N-terminal domain-containing protein [Candidatus Polarisedimenticolaceae bacterium]|nr:glutathione S-transferase N-terminal domain-containing protein [Candidatus Polarisedimenticolaceae bacterium]
MNELPILYIGEKNRSSWSMRAWVALKHKGIPFEERVIKLVDDKNRVQRRKVSLTGKVPVLHHGTLVIPDSLAIIEYLEEVYPAPAYAALWPPDRAVRAHARWLAAAMHSGYGAIRNHMSFNLCFLPEVPPAHPDALAEAQEVLALWEETLARPDRAGGPYLCGAFSAADVMFATLAVRLKAFKVPTADFPRAAKWMEAVFAVPAVAAWMDEARKLPPSAD